MRETAHGATVSAASSQKKKKSSIHIFVLHKLVWYSMQKINWRYLVIL